MGFRIPHSHPAAPARTASPRPAAAATAAVATCDVATSLASWAPCRAVSGLAVTADGAVIVADSGNHRIRVLGDAALDTVRAW